MPTQALDVNMNMMPVLKMPAKMEQLALTMEALITNVSVLQDTAASLARNVPRVTTGTPRIPHVARSARVSSVRVMAMNRRAARHSQGG